MIPAPAMAVVILAGGESRRMGSDKAALDWHGQPMLDHMVAVARAAGAEVAVAGPQAPAGVERLADAIAGRGPLGGILAALQWRPRVLILAGDMPLVTAALLRYLWDCADGFEGWTVAADQPLCAVYTSVLQPWLEAATRETICPSLAAILAPAPRRDCSPAALRAAGFSARLFANLNTPADYLAHADRRAVAPGVGACKN